MLTAAKAKEIEKYMRDAVEEDTVNPAYGTTDFSYGIVQMERVNSFMKSYFNSDNWIKVRNRKFPGCEVTKICGCPSCESINRGEENV